MSQRPDFLNGRGIGWACPLASMVRQRSVYAPAGSPGRSAAQCAFASRIGHTFGLPVASKPSVSFGIASPGRSPPHFFGTSRIVASVHGAVMKYGYQVPPYSETREYVRRIRGRYNLMRDPTTARYANNITRDQVAKVGVKDSAPLTSYERNVYAVRLPDGRLQLVSQ